VTCGLVNGFEETINVYAEPGAPGELVELPSSAIPTAANRLSVLLDPTKPKTRFVLSEKAVRLNFLKFVHSYVCFLLCSH